MFSCKLHFAVCNVMLLTPLLPSNDKTTDVTSLLCLNFSSHRIRHRVESIMGKKCQKVTGYLPVNFGISCLIRHYKFKMHPAIIKVFVEIE